MIDDPYAISTYMLFLVHDGLTAKSDSAKNVCDAEFVASLAARAERDSHGKNFVEHLSDDQFSWLFDILERQRWYPEQFLLEIDTRSYAVYFDLHESSGEEIREFLKDGRKFLAGFERGMSAEAIHRSEIAEQQRAQDRAREKLELQQRIENDQLAEQARRYWSAHDPDYVQQQEQDLINWFRERGISCEKIEP